MKFIASLVATTMLATGAVAHSVTDATTPENGAVVAGIPSEIRLSFTDDIRLTRVDLVHQDDESIQLDLGDQTKFGRSFDLPVQGFGEGTYRVEWRGLGADGHVMRCEFSFTVE